MGKSETIFRQSMRELELGTRREVFASYNAIQSDNLDSVNVPNLWFCCAWHMSPKRWYRLLMLIMWSEDS